MVCITVTSGFLVSTVTHVSPIMALTMMDPVALNLDAYPSQLQLLILQIAGPLGNAELTNPTLSPKAIIIAERRLQPASVDARDGAVLRALFGELDDVGDGSLVLRLVFMVHGKT